MNKIFTLLALAFSLVTGTSAWAQTSTSFSTAQEVANLKANCWRFNGFDYSTTDLAGSTGSVVSTLSDLPTITTPLLSKPAGDLTVTLLYRVLDTKTGNTAIKADLWDNGIAYTNNIDKKNVSAGSSGSLTFTMTAKNVTSNFTVVLSASNMSVVIDELTISASPTPGGCQANSTLPVRLMNFQGAVSRNRAQLQWSVADNEDGNYMQVLKSLDGKTFAEAGTVFTSGKTGAESYAFSDGADLGTLTYYKLRIVNKDNSVSYSNTILLKNAATMGSSGITLMQNPVESTLTFSYTAPAATQSNVNIYSTSGVKIYSSRISSQQGLNTVSLNLDRYMASGTYILEVSNGSERSMARLLKK